MDPRFRLLLFLVCCMKATVQIGWSEDEPIDAAGAMRSSLRSPALADSIGLAFTLAWGASARAQRFDIGKATIKTPTPIDHVERRIDRFPIVRT